MAFFRAPVCVEVRCPAPAAGPSSKFQTSLVTRETTEFLLVNHVGVSTEIYQSSFLNQNIFTIFYHTQPRISTNFNPLKSSLKFFAGGTPVTLESIGISGVPKHAETPVPLGTSIQTPVCRLSSLRVWFGCTVVHQSWFEVQVFNYFAAGSRCRPGRSHLETKW